MITPTLIDDDVWAEAPEDPAKAFLFIATRARKKFEDVLADNKLQQAYDITSWRRQYIYELSSVAEELKVGGLVSAQNAVASSDNMNSFDASLARVLTAIRVRFRDEQRHESVQLPYLTKSDIREKLEAIRAAVNASNLSEEVKTRLHRRINAVESELDKSRSSLAPITVLAGSLMLYIAHGTSFMADAPDALGAIKSIVHEVGLTKNDEDRRHQELTSPPRLAHHVVKQIEDHSGQQP